MAQQQLLVPLMQRESARALEAIGVGAGTSTNALIAVLTRSNEDWYVQESALGALGKIGPSATSAIPTLTGLLKHFHPNFRESAAKALGSLGGDASAAIPDLRQLCSNDPAPYVRLAASNAIERITSQSNKHR